MVSNNTRLYSITYRLNISKWQSLAQHSIQHRYHDSLMTRALVQQFNTYAQHKILTREDVVEWLISNGLEVPANL